MLCVQRSAGVKAECQHGLAVLAACHPVLRPLCFCLLFESYDSTMGYGDSLDRLDGETKGEAFSPAAR